MPKRTGLPLTLCLWLCQCTRVKENICSSYHPCSSSSLNNSSGVTVDARSLREREKRRKEQRKMEGWRGKNRERLYFSLPVLSILIRASSDEPSGVSECMEAISTPRGGSQTPLISSWRLIHSDCERTGVIPPASACQPGQPPPRWQPAPLLETLTLGKC